MNTGHIHRKEAGNTREVSKRRMTCRNISCGLGNPSFMGGGGGTEKPKGEEDVKRMSAHTCVYIYININIYIYIYLCVCAYIYLYM